MFFPDRIKNISKNDKVLEIGPGGNPYYRSDVFLDKKYSDEKEFRHQRGNTPKLITNKPVFYYSGKEKFPFENNSFDYVINCLIEVCNHDIIQAEQCAFITHYNGKCDIKKGDYKSLKPLKESLVKKGLRVTIN